MADQTLYVAGYGVSFVLGLGLVLRPGVIIAALVFKPVFLATVLMLVAGVLAVVPMGTSENLPALVAGALSAGVGGLVGLKLRRLTRGGF